MRPRTVLLEETKDFDLLNLTQEQESVICKSPFIFLVLLAEACGFWDGKIQYHAVVTIADEAHVIFTCVSLVV